MSSGVCKLTGHTGKFVKAHLIPEALTRPAAKGHPFTQAGAGTRPTRRWSSWYDRRLVFRKGEDILASYDTWAVAELRKRKLVWSGWGDSEALEDQHTLIEGTPYGIRAIEDLDSRKLRLFFLSLLWRAAASDLPEFAEITVPTNDLSLLRQMLLDKNSGSPCFYPMQAIQISTLGVVHNHTPINDLITLPAIADHPEREIPMIRFYFDGLIVHIHKQTHEDGAVIASGPLTLGNNNKFLLSTVTYEASLQRLHLDQVALEHGIVPFGYLPTP